MATVAVDFDGVCHAYSRGWQNGTIYDEPVPGAFDAIRYLQQSYAVVIFTCRDTTQVALWLRDHGIPCAVDPDASTGLWDDREIVLVSNRKPLTVAYIDDRGIRWTSWDQALTDFEAHEAAYRDRTGLDRVREAVTAARGGPPPVPVQGFA